MDYCPVHCPVCHKYIVRAPPLFSSYVVELIAIQDEPTALYCSPECRRAEEVPSRPHIRAAPTFRRIAIPRCAIEVSSILPHSPTASQSPTIPSFPSPRLARNPYNHSSPEELAYDMAHVAETPCDASPTPALRTSSRTPAHLGSPDSTVKNDDTIISWLEDVNNHAGARSGVAVPPPARQYIPAKLPFPSPAFAISARRPAPPTLSTACSDFDELFAPSSRGTIPSPHVLDDSSTTVLTSAIDEEFSSDEFDDDNLTNPSSVSGSMNEKYGDTSEFAVQLQTWMAPSVPPPAPIPLNQPPAKYGHPRRISHHQSQSNPLDLTSFGHSRPSALQPQPPRKSTWHLGPPTRTTSTSSDSSYDSCDELESRVRMVQGRRHSSVTTGMRLVEILEGAGQADPDALWSSRGRTHGRLRVVPRISS